MARLFADVVVIGVPMYNFIIASQPQAWVDRIIVLGNTVSYGAGVAHCDESKAKALAAAHTAIGQFTI